MSALTGMLTKMLLLMLCFIAEFTSAQVTFSPDPEEDVHMQVTPLTPPVEITTVDTYPLGIVPRFKVQYVTADDSRAVYDIIDIEGQPVSESAFERLFSSQYKTVLNSLTFIEDPRLIGSTFRLKATLNNNEERSTLSRRTYTFPAPFNLTGSSVRAIRNSPFTWTCHVTSDFPVIEWYRDSTSLTQVGVLLNGSCLSFGKNDSYVYGCHRSELTYTLTIPGTSLVEELQSSNWRCKYVSTEVKGSVSMELNIVSRVPVTIKDNKSESDSTGSRLSFATVGGVAGALLLIIAILVSVMIVRERQYRKEKGQRATNPPIQLHEYDSHRGINQQGTETDPNNADQSSIYEELQSQGDVHTYGHIGSGSANAQGLDQSCAYEDLQTNRDVHTYGHVGSRPLNIEMR